VTHSTKFALAQARERVSRVVVGITFPWQRSG
jgi:hypothetical protein